jgi:hypothetical protein
VVEGCGLQLDPDLARLDLRPVDGLDPDLVKGAVLVDKDGLHAVTSRPLRAPIRAMSAVL